MPAHRFLVIGLTNDILLDFIELMDAKDTACILAVGSSLAAEAGTESYEAHGQVFGLENFILEHAGDRYFSGADEEGVIILDGVDLVTPLGELATADKAEIKAHGGHDKGGKVLFSHAIYVGFNTFHMKTD